MSDNLPDLPSETTHHLLLILRETVHNAIRHAQAGKITIICDKRREGLYVSIIDDGIGFVEAEGNIGHHGIVNSRKRVEKLGGTFQIYGYPNRGTEVSLVIPL